MRGCSTSFWVCFPRAAIGWFPRVRRKRPTWRIACVSTAWCGCCGRAGAKWSDFQERLRDSIPAVVLVSDGYDADMAASLQESGGHLLRRPLQEPELDRVLGAVESRAPTRA